LHERLITCPGGAVLVDDSLAPDWSLEYFEPAYWRARGMPVEELAGGRGTITFVQTATGDWVLRHYRRGGFVAHLFDDHYLWQGRDRTRSFREWRLLKRLFELGLPVPRPIAASWRRRGAAYTADLITLRVPGARPLSQHLAEAALPERGWQRLGACVRRFHDAGVYHADLTAHNLLLDHTGHPWMLDFDRGRIRRSGRWQRSNLDRLLRSLNKISMENPSTQFAPGNWDMFLSGYDHSPE
jgi:3-deoxy-D-manno-octulosonic acid kinase